MTVLLEMVEKTVHGSKTTIPVLAGVFLANIKDSQLDRKSALAPKTQHRPYSSGGWLGQIARRRLADPNTQKLPVWQACVKLNGEMTPL
jgi:hypothetical protein